MYTKGKWIVKQYGEQILVKTTDGRIIATVDTAFRGEIAATDNAKLIAAAPTMLELLEWIEHHATQEGLTKEILQSVTRKALAAIKKATS